MMIGDVSNVGRMRKDLVIDREALMKEIHMHDICLCVLQSTIMDRNWINNKCISDEYKNEVEEFLDLA
ncbi:hypothetical protein CR513_10008, partial [Mucuna pruriens]